MLSGDFLYSKIVLLLEKRYTLLHVNDKVKIRYQNKMFPFISHALNYIGTTCGQIHFRGWFVNRIYGRLNYFVKTFDATMESKSF